MKKITDLDRLVRQKVEAETRNVQRVIKTETANFVKENFKRQGFQSNTGFEKWKPRKTTDTQGRDLLYYKKGKRAGRLTRFGRRHKGRAILIGHHSGNKMRDSYRYVSRGKTLEVHAKDYAKYHNEGGEYLPRRPMIGRSKVLVRRIKKALRL